MCVRGPNKIIILSFPEYELCPCLGLPSSFKSALASMLDVSLLRDPAFMLIGVSNVFGMAGLYVPFVYIVDAATLSVCTYLILFTQCCELPSK